MKLRRSVIEGAGNLERHSLPRADRPIEDAKFGLDNPHPERCQQQSGCRDLAEYADSVILDRNDQPAHERGLVSRMDFSGRFTLDR